MFYKISEKVLNKFVNISSRNISQEDSLHIETLAFLLGHGTSTELTATELIFPDQEGFAFKVNDKGKI